MEIIKLLIAFLPLFLFLGWQEKETLKNLFKHKGERNE
tara:strand:+ start:95 stop:208 length:114 start_codon:yes stop_codon:yes gene_type:complete